MAYFIVVTVFPIYCCISENKTDVPRAISYQCKLNKQVMLYQI